ncbi:Gfo/Idh/MocA family oxidoreductase [Actinomadura sp. KC216]|uniref:Gfo/Idh/MocA family protein n=1 Tax=Actinomadura sp. KC216 TaxID=2530370 RepID=UPI0010537D94|nr:Gfo/Idh/MocA family oxidoreductase [Actinomadura sp. KC216]TDB90710.1 Gfo/Idh/MocA family oxidoreductase [Actinomadura sp. KC216]
MHTLIIGMGRAGTGLHWPVLRKLRSEPESSGLFSGEPPLAWDIRGPAAGDAPPGLRLLKSLKQARKLVDPGRTVVHVCTPPQQRVETVRRLAELGFRHLLLEKPLADRYPDARRIAELRAELGLRIIVVAPWQTSALTRRAADLVASGTLGELRSVTFSQRKPRFERTLRDGSGLTVFDVEPPHSVGVALTLAGDAEVAAASWSDLRIGDAHVPRMGAGRLTLRHAAARTRIFSDLAAPVRERRLTLRFTGGTFTGHYPVSESDCYAFALVSTPGGTTEDRFPDDSLTEFIRHTYLTFAGARPDGDEFGLGLRVARLLDDAKAMCRGLDDGAAAPPIPRLTDLGAVASHA